MFLVRQKNIDNFFALKSVLKSQVYEQGLEKYILVILVVPIETKLLKQEKAILEAINFPFIMQLVTTFKDSQHLYFLTEYIKGMELFDVIREIGILNFVSPLIISGLLGTYDSQFYIGSMILAIEYLHTKKILYRDLKPENIMVDHTVKSLKLSETYRIGLYEVNRYGNGKVFESTDLSRKKNFYHDWNSSLYGS